MFFREEQQYKNGVVMVVRMPACTEMDSVYLMGMDVWSGGDSAENYLKDCYGSEKYGKGQWLVLTLQGELVSSLILYRGGFNLPENHFGIGSVATRPKFRNAGYAAYLIEEVVSSIEDEECDGVYLFSDTGYEYYQKLGFSLLSSQSTVSESPCMVRRLKTGNSISTQMPTYF